MGLFENRQNKVPVWFMRQAGRYHAHYQGIKKNSNFMEMCKNPDLACEVTMGPIEDFDFDAAILFSDLLFPLEQMGMGLEYSPGPKLHRLFTQDSIKNLEEVAPPSEFYNFQKEALLKLKTTLPKEKTLLGFVGAPFTLYTYATEGSHAGALFKAKRGLYNGLFEKFYEVLLPNLIMNMEIQAQGNPDAICLFDTAAGELTKKDFKNFLLPKIYEITKTFKSKYPNIKIVYYSKHTSLEYLQLIEDENIDVLGFDWRVDLKSAFETLPDRYYLQGNFDPCWLHLSWNDCKENAIEFFKSVPDKYFDRWVCGLGHGVLIETPEGNVRNFVKLLRETIY